MASLGSSLLFIPLVLLAFVSPAWAQAPKRPAYQGEPTERAGFIREHYTKYEYRIPMRDGVRLFTSVYVPNEASPRKRYPILLQRTPYSVAPYGVDRYKRGLGSSVAFEKEGFIFAFQDVRGRNLSEGEFVNVRPQLPTKRGAQDIDESTDTYDTIQ